MTLGWCHKVSILWLMGFQIECWFFGLTCVDLEWMLLWFYPYIVHLLMAFQSSSCTDAACIQKVIILACDWLHIRWILSNCCSEPVLNCSHRFWPMKPKATLHFLLLSCHFRVRMVTALQWPGRELPHVTGKLEVFLNIYDIISL